MEFLVLCRTLAKIEIDETLIGNTAFSGKREKVVHRFFGLLRIAPSCRDDSNDFVALAIAVHYHK
jgi:hypothetical protein